MKTQNDLIKDLFRLLGTTYYYKDGGAFHPITVNCAADHLTELELVDCINALKESIDV